MARKLTKGEGQMKSIWKNLGKNQPKLGKAKPKTKPVHGTREGAPKSELTMEQHDKLVVAKSNGVLGRIVAKADSIKTKAAERKGKRVRHGVVKALAGTGKTWTLIMGVAWCFRNAVVAGRKLWQHVEDHEGKVTPSPQQQKVWEFIASEPFQTVTYAAYNNTIVKDFGVKWQWLVDLLQQAGVTFQFATINSLGNKVTGRHYRFGWKAVNKFNVRNLLELHWQTKPEYAGKTLNDLWKDKADVIRAVEDLVGLCKLTLSYRDNSRIGIAGPGKATPEQVGIRGLEVDDEQLTQMAELYGIELKGFNAEIFELVNVLLNKCRSPGDNGVKNYDFDDQIWLPLVNGLDIPKVDLLLVDEAQDFNRCRQEFAMRSGHRILIVGDENQAIYGFAGADTESMDRMAAMLAEQGDVEVMPLTVTRRCSKVVVELAAKIVPGFEAHPSNKEGEELDLSYNEAYEMLDQDDLVLCRINAPLVRVAFSMLRLGRPATLLGNQLDVQLIDFVKRACRGTKYQPQTRDVSGFLEYLDEYEQQTKARLEKRAIRDAGAADALVALQDKCECLRVFCDGATTVDQVIENIKEVFVNRPGGTLLSSGHRAKGMEAERVFIMRPDLLPHPRAKTPMARKQEEHLKYVMITRSKNIIAWVSGEAKE